MKQPDDYRQPGAPLHNNETDGMFFEQSENYSKRQAVERSFEIQSGYLVLIKQLGSRYALSFKRQIGTPPSTSIFLTADEGQRLADVLGANKITTVERIDSTLTEQEQNLSRVPYLRRRHRSPFTVFTVLFIITMTLCVVMAFFVYQTQIHSRGW